METLDLIVIFGPPASKHKASKRDIAFSDKLLKRENELYRTNSTQTERIAKRILKIENTNKTATEVAHLIDAHFELS